MKYIASVKLPKKTSKTVEDKDNPAWTEGMLGAPVIKVIGRAHATFCDADSRTAEHPEAEVEHIVRGIVRKGLKPLPDSGSPQPD